GRVPRRVAQRLAGGGGERLGGAIQRALTEDRELDDGIVVVLDLGHRLAQRRAERLGAEFDLTRHPGSQLVLLPARQARDGGWVVRLPLHQRERLQDGIVQVGGDAAALVLTRGGQARAVRAGHARDRQRDGDDGRR